jgi:fucose permease
MIDRDRDADKFAVFGGLAVLPLALGVLGSWLWPLFNSAGSSDHQVFKMSEILGGFGGGAVLGLALGAVLLHFRKTTEPAVEEPAVDPFE